MNDKLLYKREFPVGSTRPCSVDTVSFNDATVEEVVTYFKERIEEFKSALAFARSEKLDEAEQKIVQLQKDAVNLNETICEKQTIINYIEQKLEYRDY